MKIARVNLLAAAALAGLASPALASQPAGPSFKPDRTAEDYAYLKDPARRGAALDALKYIPLDDAGDVYLSLGGDVRERVEAFDRPVFGIGGREADTYLLQRVLLHADLHLGSAVRIFGQIGAHEAFGKSVLAAPDEDHLDVHQLFVEVRPAAPLAIRFGRQEMAFNPSQRFVSFRDGTNVRQNFDGARATLTQGRLRIDAFLVEPVVQKRGTFDDVRNRQQSFGGVYASAGLDAKRARTIDGYYFYLDRDVASFGGVTGEEHRHSLGLRSGGSSGRWDWDVEGLVQRGTFAGRTIHAWGVGADMGYAVPGALKPRLGLRFDGGSGDRSATDGVVGTFNPLFPKGPYFNEANVTSFANLLALRPSLRLQPAPRLTLEAAAQWKWKEARGDAVYLGPATPIAGTRGGPREIGQVLTMDAVFKLNRFWSLRGYYLHHSAGPAIAAAGGHAIDFAMGSVQLQF